MHDAMAEALYGTVTNGVIVPTGRRWLPEGTPVVVFPRPDKDGDWLRVSAAAELHGTSATRVRQWAKSGKVRVHSQDAKLVNASDVEDAIEQDDLLALSMASAEENT